MKEYTTPRVTIVMRGAGKLLEKAETVLITAKNGKAHIDKPAEINGESVSALYTQDETASFAPGTILFEVTIKMPDGTVMKSETVKSTMREAVRREVL